MKQLLFLLMFSSMIIGGLQAETVALTDRQASDANVTETKSLRPMEILDSIETADEVITHTSLSEGAPSLKAKFGSGLTITTANESFSMQIRGRFQSLVRVIHVYNSEDPAAVNAQVRRARLKIGGYVGKAKASPDDKVSGKHRMKYNVQFGYSNRDIVGIAEGSGLLLDAYLTYSPTKHLSIQFGQAKLPGNREAVTSSQKQQFVDRSFASTFRLDRDFGLQLKGKFGEGVVFKPTFSLAMGEGRNYTSLNTSGLDYTFKAELLPLGDFKKGKGDYVGADVDREPEPKLAIAVSYDLNHNALFSRGQRGGTLVERDDRTSIHTVFADVLLKCRGLSVAAEYTRRTVDTDYEEFYTTGHAATASMGYVFPRHFEVAARYSRLMPIENRDQPVDEQTGTNTYTLGMSKYFLSHNLKIQSDYTWTTGVNSEEIGGLWRLQVEVAF
jgi:hypothetical protein